MRNFLSRLWIRFELCLAGIEKLQLPRSFDHSQMREEAWYRKMEDRRH